MNKYEEKICEIVSKKMVESLPNPWQSLNHDNFVFYVNRIHSAVKYGLVQGRELIKMGCRTAFHDSELTLSECELIIQLCHNNDIDNILMEVNFNEGW